ncbi:MAG: phosphate acyltransferase PlsX [Clostridia bacterium]|nr:phosphate acyltransferase PlsX [Clostridia bacterium]
MKKIVVDIYGGDNAPIEIIEGCLLAMKDLTDLTVVMCGNQDEIKNYLADKVYDETRVEFVDAKDVITNDEAPTVAIRTKKESSLVKALEYTKENADAIGMVSAGSTGAVLAGATLKIGRIRGLQRPALAPLLPTLVPNKQVMLCDCGANVDCKPEMLLQFAQMGHAFMQSMFGIKNPRIGLLSNGTEDKKGNQLVHETFALLKQSNLNFVGNMEAREILSGDYDVVVADGFYGNIALKSIEGAALMVMKTIKKEVTATFKRKMGALLLKSAFADIKEVMDYNKKGGAPFVGVNKVVVKSHGSSDRVAICGSIKQVVQLDKSNFVENIKPYFAKVEENA